MKIRPGGQVSDDFIDRRTETRGVRGAGVLVTVASVAAVIVIMIALLGGRVFGGD